MKKKIFIITLVLITLFIIFKPKNKPETKQTYSDKIDVVSEATSEDYSKTKMKKYTLEEKTKLMFWSNQPKVGYITGDYYYQEGLFDGSYKGTIEVIVENDKIIKVEYDEFAPSGYYIKKYANVSKRYSDYAFEQFRKDRTDYTLVTIVNGITFVESQMVKENRLDGNFNTLRGSSNSARKGLMPLANKIDLKTKSNLKYHELTKEVEKGIYGTLKIVYDDQKISKIFYDEIMASNKEEIKNPLFSDFYRQSKYHALDFKEKTKIDFKDMVDQITKQIIQNNSLENLKYDGTANKEFENLKTLINEFKQQKNN